MLQRKKKKKKDTQKNIQQYSFKGTQKKDYFKKKIRKCKEDTVSETSFW